MSTLSTGKSNSSKNSVFGKRKFELNSKEIQKTLSDGDGNDGGFIKSDLGSFDSNTYTFKPFYFEENTVDKISIWADWWISKNIQNQKLQKAINDQNYEELLSILND